MYIVKDLQYENKYIQWAQNKYKNIKFYQTPHYAIYSFIKAGYLGIKKDTEYNKMTISRIDRDVRIKYNIEFSVYGFKKNDGITRRMMLKEPVNGIHPKTNKCYPLMDLKNEEVLRYISDNSLIIPFNYGTTKPSSGCDISRPEFLYYIRKKYPEDLKKIYNQFPVCEAILFRYENR